MCMQGESSTNVDAASSLFILFQETVLFLLQKMQNSNGCLQKAGFNVYLPPTGQGMSHHDHRLPFIFQIFYNVH